MGASHILMVGSSKPHLQQIAIDIFSVCLSFSISLDSQWLPRQENARTDLLSRFIDRDDWSLNPVVFQYLITRWGPILVDRSSSYFNSQVVRFNPKYFSPGCTRMLTPQPKTGVPIVIVCVLRYIWSLVRTGKHLRVHKGVGSLMVPEWPSASFWPFLHSSLSLSRSSSQTSWSAYWRSWPECSVSQEPNSVFVGCPSFNMLALPIDLAGLHRLWFSP